MSEKSKGGAGNKGKADSSGRGTADARAGGVAQQAKFQLACLSAASGGTAQRTQRVDVDDGYIAGLRAGGDSLSWQASRQNIGNIVDGFLQWLKTRGSPSAGGAAAPPPRDAPAAHAAHAASDVEDSDGDDMHEYDWSKLESGEHAGGGHGRASVLPSASLYSVVVWTQLGRAEMIDKR
jgi:hypothetical protein